MVSGKESTFLGMKSTLSDGNLNKTHLLHFGVLSMFLGSYLAQGLERLFLLWFVLGLLPEENREGTGEGNLNKSAFFTKASE